MGLGGRGLTGVGAVAFVAAGVRWLSPADVHCIVGPMVRPFLRTEVATLEAVGILENLKKPVGCSFFGGGLGFMGRHSCADCVGGWVVVEECV